MSKQTGTRHYGDGSYTSLSNGKWRFKRTFIWHDSDGKHTKTVEAQGKTQREALSRWNKKTKQLEKGIKKEKNITLYDSMTEWLQYKKLELKQTSYQKLEQTARCRVFNSTLKDIPLKQITRNDIENLLNDYARTEPSFSSYKKAYELFTAFYKWAVGKGLVNVNPTTNMIFLKSKCEIFKKKKEIEWFDVDDIKLFLNEATRLTRYDNISGIKGPFHPQGYILAANIFLGLRVSELIALRWKDIDFENNIINVDKQLISIPNPEYDTNNEELMKREHITKQILIEKHGLKYGEKRNVGLNDTAKEILLKAKSFSKNDENDYVCQTRNGNHCCPESLRGAMQTIEKYANTKCQSPGLHILRHTCATLMYTAGIDIGDMADTLGDKIQVVESTYIHAEKKYGVVQRTNRITEKLNMLLL